MNANNLKPDNEFIYNNKDPLNGLNLSQFKKKLVNLLYGKVINAYLFGSINTPNFNKDSDVDLILVIDNTKIEFHKRYRLFPKLYEIEIDFDLRIYTKNEFDLLIKEGDSGFWESVKATMLKII